VERNKYRYFIESPRKNTIRPVIIPEANKHNREHISTIAKLCYPQTHGKRERKEKPYMARIEMRVSDLSGSIIQDDAALQHITVEHPEFPNPLQLDATVDDLEGRLPEPQDVVTLTVNDQRFLLSVQEFQALFTGSEEAAAVLERVDREQRPRQRRRRQGGTQRRSRIDYASPEHAGEDHPGRISVAERAYVRDHLDEVNERLSQKGMREIDPNDPEMAERYGLPREESIEDAGVFEETPQER
jgi:hypothetical protein